MKKKVLVLGAGMVAGPLVSYLARHGFHLTVTDIDLSKARAKAEGLKNVQPLRVDSGNTAGIEDLIRENDLVISLLPAQMHPRIARLCIQNRRGMVTASYVSPAMETLDRDAQSAGVILLNEIGADPGIDHLSAMRLFDQARSRGGRITSFLSCCGGLPAPQANTNPMGYKFSWSPLGVLKAAASEARYLRDGETVVVNPRDLFSHYWLVDTGDFGVFEAYPNRNSLEYIDLYGLSGISTLCRGTFRNISHCETWHALARLGFFSTEPDLEKIDCSIRRYLLRHLLKVNEKEDPKTMLMKKLGLSDSSVVLRKFQWLGLFDDRPLPRRSGTPMDILAAIMMEKMAYRSGEQDMLLMHHDITAEYPESRERITSTLMEVGERDGDSAMARTVGLPAAIAARMILEDRIRLSGVLRPLTREIYNPILDELARLGITLAEKVVSTEEIR